MVMYSNDNMNNNTNSLEKKVRINNRKNNLKKILLQTVMVSGVVAVSLIAPGVLVAMKKLGILPKNRQKESINSCRNKLIKSGYLKYQNDHLEITQKGENYLNREIIYENTKNQKRKWDCKWRVLIFDIPERKKIIREQIRRTLISVGFMRLQDSVWIYPYDCEKLITLLKADLKIGKDVLYMIVEALEYDKPVRLYFGFSR